MTCVIILQLKCPLAIKVDKSENFENAFYVFTFFWHDTSKNVKSRVFRILKKNVKNVFSNYGCKSSQICCFYNVNKHTGYGMTSTVTSFAR